VIVSSGRSKRKSNSNYRKLREAMYKKIKSRLLSRLLEQLLVGLNNNSNKLLKLLKREKR
jgi:hypothetical protein